MKRLRLGGSTFGTGGGISGAGGCGGGGAGFPDTAFPWHGHPAKGARRFVSITTFGLPHNLQIVGSCSTAFLAMMLSS